MSVPRVIRINREEGYHTDQIGRCADGRQFMAFVTATIPIPPPEDWESQKRWYAVLHTFDAQGTHLQTDAAFAGTTADGEWEVVKKAEGQLERMITALGSVTYGDVEVGLFEVKIDGETFGLIDASEPDEQYEAIHLVPNDFAFFEPWDGTYDT